MNKPTDPEVLPAAVAIRPAGAVGFPALNIEALLEKAIDAKSGIEVLQAMQVMRREMMAEQAKRDYDAALAAFQAECPPIVKSKGVESNGQLMYKFAPLEDIVAHIKPYLQRHGLSFVFDTDIASVDGWVIAKCKVTHTGGHTGESTGKFPLGAGTRMMSATQVYAGALTFANRRVLCNALGLVVAGEDSDGRVRAKEKPAGPSTMEAPNPALKQLAKALWDALETVRGDKKNWDLANQFLWKHEILDAAAEERAPNLSPEKFGQVINRVKELLPK